MFSTFFRQALRKNAENITAASFLTALYGVNCVLFCRHVDQLKKDNPGCTVQVESSYIPGAGPHYKFAVEKQDQPEFNPKP